jgi:signal transduction histidine kinase/PAS domain-containing protein
VASTTAAGTRPSPSEATALLESTDWSKTPLGPRSEWPQSLRLAVAICLGSRFPMFVWWGRELVNIYNDAYVPILGQRHPRAFGQPARDTWHEIWDVVGPQADAVMERGEATWNERVLLVMERHGYPEQTWFTWSYSPIREESGLIRGLFCACKEDTAAVQAESERDALLARMESDRTRLAEAFSQSPAFLAVLRGPDHVFEFVNDRYHDLVGRRDLVGQSLGQALPELEEQGFVAILDKVYATGEPFVGTDVRVLVRRPPSEVLEAIDLDFVYQPMKGPDGAVAGILAHGVDVTEKNRTEATLASDKKVLEGIATGAPLSEVLETIARGAEAQSADGMLCSILVLDEAGERLLHGAAPSLPESYNQAIDTLPIGPGMGSCGTAAFQRRPVFVTDIAADPLWASYRQLAADHGLGACCSTPVLGSGGEVLGTVAMYYRHPHVPSARDSDLIRSATHLAGIVLAKEMVDRRLRHSLEAEQAARAEAERASRLKDEFLATLSHELRTPLSAILGWTRIIRLKPDVPADLVRGVDVIERNANAQATIIQDLLDMSAIMSGKVRLNIQTTDLAALVQAAIDTATPAAEAKQIRLEAVLHEDGPVLIAGDADRLQQVLWNLLSNAVKFTPKDGRIQVALERVASQVQVRVEDTGAGIAPAFMPHVFDRFRQADASTTRRHGGLGLGLSIVKQLVELHGGSVTVSSEGPGRGSVFVVTLPVAALRPAVETAIAPRAAGHPMPAVEDYVAVDGVRVLVVDDDADAREMVRRLLQERGCVVATAGSVNEALHVLGRGRFDVLVSDIGMPGEDGHALIRRIRALGAEAGGDIPAVALTAYARPEDRAKALRAGFQRHTVKPIDPVELFSLVARLAGRG